MEKLRDCFNRKKGTTYSSLSIPNNKVDKEKEKEKTPNAVQLVKKLIPFLWPKKETKIKIMVVISLTLMAMSKVSNIVAPMAYRNAIDILTTDTNIIQNQQIIGNITQNIDGDYTNDYDINLNDDSQKKLDDLNKKTGKDFDKAYTNDMLDDHEDAIDAFQKGSNNLQDADLKNFATQTLPTLQMHQDSIKAIAGKK